MSETTAFTSEQFDALYPVGVEHHYWSVARRLIIKRVLDRTMTKKTGILEIGCGRGVVLSYLRKNGYESLGVELSQGNTNKNSNEILYGTDFKDLDSDIASSVTTVLLLDVIEHIEHTDQFFADIQAKFPRLERVVITVPAGTELWSNFDIFNGHFRRYNAKSLTALVLNSGMKLVYRSYFFHGLYIPIWVAARMHLKRTTSVHPPYGYIKLFHWLLGWYFYVEYVCFGSFLTGSSLIAVGSYEHQK
jgi:cyclopropane fatty-acyl-phospholipid synthase-like methyltransferase